MGFGSKNRTAGDSVMFLVKGDGFAEGGGHDKIEIVGRVPVKRDLNLSRWNAASIHAGRA
jgi:hypothetical protein